MPITPPPSPARAATDAQVIALWNLKVEEAMKGGLTKPKAVRSVAIANPALQRQYIGAYTREMRRGNLPGRTR